MNDVDYDRVVRCIAVITTMEGLDTFAHLVSNVFDLDFGCAMQDLYNAKKKYEKHRQLGGGIKAFENGEILK